MQPEEGLLKEFSHHHIHANLGWYLKGESPKTVLLLERFWLQRWTLKMGPFNFISNFNKHLKNSNTQMYIGWYIGISLYPIHYVYLQQRFRVKKCIKKDILE